MAALESKPVVGGLTALVSLIILLAYTSARNTIDRAAPVMFWVFVGIVGILSFFFIWSQLEKLLTLRAQMKATRSIAQSEATRANNEANAPLVIKAQQGEQIIVRDMDVASTYRKVTEDIRTHVNGHHQEPSPLEVQLFMIRQGGYGGQRDAGQLVIDQQSVASEGYSLDILNQYDSEWIQSLLNAPHVHLCGASGCGKTMLANHILTHIQKTDPQAQFYLLNPKNIASRKPFIIDPIYDDVDLAEEALMHFIGIMEKRRHDPNFDKNSSKIVFVVDELDYIKQMKGENVSQLVNPLIKMGRELNIKVVVISQSSLSKDTGITQSSFSNLCRVAIWAEGEKLLKGSSISKRSKSPLVVEYEKLRNLSKQHELQTGNDLRYCMMIPLNGNPSVQVIPPLEDPVAEQKRITLPTLKPTKGSYDMKVCRAWHETATGKSPSGNKMHKLITQNNVRINGRQKQNYVEILQKYGINPGFLEKSI